VKRDAVGEPTLEPAVESDGDELLSLFERVFGKRPSEAHWRWKYGGPSVDGAASNWIVRESETHRPVFHYGGLPAKLRTPLGELPIRIAVDAMTSPEFRGRGFLRLAGRDVFAEWRRSGVVAVIGLPNLAGTRIGAGFDKIGELRWYWRPLRPWLLDRLLRRRTAGAHPVRADDAAFDAIWQTLRREDAFSIVRDRAWIRWRHHSEHDGAHLFGAHRDAHELGYVAINEKGVLTSLCAPKQDDAVASSLIEVALEFARERKLNSVRALAVPGSSTARALRKAGFVPRRFGFDVHLAVLDEALARTTVRDLRHWCLQGSDFDVV
jgi:hypothetical protein